MNLTKDFGRYLLTFGPAPIERLLRLSEQLGGAVEIYAKREDCNSGLASGITEQTAPARVSCS